MNFSASIFLIPEKVIFETDKCLDVDEVAATGTHGETKSLAVASSTHFEMAVTDAESSLASL